MELTGTLKAVFETKQVSATFSTREFVITTEEQYPQHILLQLVQDKCDLIESYAEGEKITVGINLRGREWTNPQGEVKYFNTIQAWKIQKAERHEPEHGYKPPVETKTNPMEAPGSFNEEDDESDLPF